jgi:DeoR family transcriptional regulator of aga operon
MSILREQRKDKILEMIRSASRASIEELTASFSVSEATIRRDLEELAQDGRIQRLRGGAALPDSLKVEASVIQRGSIESSDKALIGKKAAELIQDDETVFLGSGSTVIEVARNLVHRSNVTVITNSLPVINLLVNAADVRVIATGGFLRNSEHSLIGHLVAKSLSELRADRIIIGIQGIHPVHGLTNEYLPETMSDRVILGFAQKVMIVADHTKFGKSKSSFVADINAVHTIVTDRAAPKDVLEALREKGIQIIVAE